VTQSTLAAVILAGGQATRMGGGDKTLLHVGGKPMLQSIISALDIAPIAISANGDPTRFARFGLPVLPDGAFAGEGPLAGVLAGLKWAASLGKTSVLTVPGDTPFLPVGLAERLFPPPSCAVSGGRSHHLVALWPVSCLNCLQMYLSVPGPRHVRRFAERIGTRHVEFPVLTRDPFANINTPHELIEIRSIYG
jgi:molybdenum cofactor guanylyltransferase